MEIFISIIAIFILLVFVALTYDKTVPLVQNFLKSCLELLKIPAKKLKDAFFYCFRKYKALRVTLFLFLVAGLLYKLYRTIKVELEPERLQVTGWLFILTIKYAIIIFPVIFILAIVVWVIHIRRTESKDTTANKSLE